MKRLLCFLGLHDPMPFRCVPRNLGHSVWDWFRVENFDYRCTRCGKISYGSSWSWRKEVDNGMA